MSARNAPAGSLVKIRYDAPRHIVRPTDVLIEDSGRMYLVLEARRQTRGNHVGRWHLEAVVLDEEPLEHGEWHSIVWHKSQRRKGRRR